MLPLLSGNEAELLRYGMDPAYYDRQRTKAPDALFQLMIAWTGNVMRELTGKESVKEE